MNYDEYWSGLVHRNASGETLSGMHERFYRLSCIYGETMVDGIEAYFERRWAEFETDMEALRDSGFSNVAAEFEGARRAMYGNEILDQARVDRLDRMLLDEEAEVQPIQREIDEIYDRLIPQLEDLNERKYEWGLRQKLYSPDAA